MFSNINYKTFPRYFAYMMFFVTKLTVYLFLFVNHPVSCFQSRRLVTEDIHHSMEKFIHIFLYLLVILMTVVCLLLITHNSLSEKLHYPIHRAPSNRVSTHQIFSTKVWLMFLLIQIF